MFAEDGVIVGDVSANNIEAAVGDRYLYLLDSVVFDANEAESHGNAILYLSPASSDPIPAIINASFSNNFGGISTVNYNSYIQWVCPIGRYAQPTGSVLSGTWRGCPIECSASSYGKECTTDDSRLDLYLDGQTM